MTEHSTGPWQWEPGTPVVTRYWYEGKEIPIATVVIPEWHEDRACGSREAGANARLIAAAPCLLAFAQAYVALFHDYTKINDTAAPSVDDCWELREQAKNAIDRATGDPTNG